MAYRFSFILFAFILSGCVSNGNQQRVMSLIESDFRAEMKAEQAAAEIGRARCATEEAKEFSQKFEGADFSAETFEEWDRDHRSVVADFTSCIVDIRKENVLPFAKHPKLLSENLSQLTGIIDSYRKGKISSSVMKMQVEASKEAYNADLRREIRKEYGEMLEQAARQDAAEDSDRRKAMRSLGADLMKDGVVGETTQPKTITCSSSGNMATCTEW